MSESKELRLLKVNKLRGPNIWGHRTALEVWVQWDSGADRHAEAICQQVRNWLPELTLPAEHPASYPGSVPMLGHLTLHLQRWVEQPVDRVLVERSSLPNTCKVVIDFVDETVALSALERAQQILRAAAQGQPVDLDSMRDQLLELAHDICLGPSTKSIVDAAKGRGIPWRRLTTGSLIQFGHGVRQRRICTAEADSTSAIAETIAQDKQLTRSLLKSIGVPVPEGWPVESAEQAVLAAEEIGYPVVIKPQFGNHGRGVATNLVTAQQVREAFAAACEEGSSIVVEKFAPGDDYRLLVVGKRLVAAARREPAHVIGDGQQTVEELIDLVNSDPRRSEGHATSLSKIPVDANSLSVLQQQGLHLDSVPKPGQRVLIRRNANLSTGGTATDVTDDVHPEVARQAVEAAQIIGLDIAGIDVVVQDISQPLPGQRGVVVEVNAGPGLRMHLEPSHGKPRAVGEAIIDLIYPHEQNGRIPIVSVTGVNGKTTTTRLVSHILACSGKRVGMTCTDGVYVHGRRIDSGDCSGPQSARSVLINPTVEAAVFETARGGILREGLGFDQCDVAIVTNIGEGDHLGISDIDTVEQLARVKRTIVEAVSGNGSAVLKADDPLVAAMASHCPGSVVFFAIDGNHPVVSERRRVGGRVAFVRDHAIVLADGPSEIRLLTLDRIPLTHNGRIGFQVENVLAAAAACWALGMPCEQIRIGLESFSAQMDKIPGRFNIVEISGATVIVDYGHNPSSLQAILDAIELFPHANRTAIYSAAGDRRDCDMIRQGELLAQAFDRVVIYEDTYLRGRAAGDITRLFREGLQMSGRVREIHDFQGWQRAVNETLKMIQPGELLLVQADVIDEAMQYLRDAFTHQSATRELDLDSAIKPTPSPAAGSTTLEPSLEKSRSGRSGC
jgi:cyanophycin synthetase